MSSTITEFALVNEDSRISDHEMQCMARAIQSYMANRVCPVWGFSPVPVRVRSKGDPGLLVNGVAVCRIVPTVKGAPPDALGWHDETRGKPVMFVETNPIYANGGVTLFSLSLPQTVTVASVVAHEVIETRGDLSVNRWVDDPTQGAYGETAEELCDACEDAIVPVTISDPSTTGLNVIVGLSSFLHPAWFDAQNKTGPFDEAHVCRSAFSLSSGGGGYKIVRQVVRGSEKDAEHTRPARELIRVQGAHYPAWRFEMKSHQHSRGARRHRIEDSAKHHIA